MRRFARSLAPDAPDINPVVIDLSQTIPPPVEWLWPERIPLGFITIVLGDPGLGKSLLTVDWSARVTRAAGWPDQEATSLPPSQVLLLNAEDRFVLRPRLEAAGADLNRIKLLDSVERDRASESRRPFSLARDLPALEKALAAHSDCRLLVIDPITAYLPASNSNEQVRDVMTSLAELAEQHRVAIVAVTHLNKRDGGRAKYRAMGALAFVAAARAVWGVIEDPQGERQVATEDRVAIQNEIEEELEEIKRWHSERDALKTEASKPSIACFAEAARRVAGRSPETAGRSGSGLDVKPIIEKIEAQRSTRQLEVMTKRMERRIQPLRKALERVVREQQTLPPDVIAKYVKKWVRKLYPEERQFLGRHLDTIRARLEKALGGGDWRES